VSRNVRCAVCPSGSCAAIARACGRSQFASEIQKRRCGRSQR